MHSRYYYVILLHYYYVIDLSYYYVMHLNYYYVIVTLNYFLDNSIHLILIIIRVKIPQHRLVEILECLKLVQIIPFIQIYQSSPVYPKECVTTMSHKYESS